MDKVQYINTRVHIDDLTLGYTGKHVDFTWSPYMKRTEQAREDYDKLVVSLFHHGMQRPCITYKNHVLIGMRRVEIIKSFKGTDWIRCIELNPMENVQEWTRDDLWKIDELKQVAGSFEY